MVPANVSRVFYGLLFSVPVIWFILPIFLLTSFWHWARVHQQFYPDRTPLLHQINKSFFKRWMSILLVCVVVRGAKFSLKEVFPHYASGCFFLLQLPRKERTGYRNIGIIGNSTFVIYYRPYILKKRFPVKLKVIASPLYSHLSSVIRLRTLLVQGLLLKQ